MRCPVSCFLFEATRLDLLLNFGKLCFFFLFLCVDFFLVVLGFFVFVWLHCGIILLFGGLAVLAELGLIVCSWCLMCLVLVLVVLVGLCVVLFCCYLRLGSGW